MTAQEQVVSEVVAEFQRASSLHPRFNSAHEGYAVILEEMDELKEEVWKRDHDKDAMRKEAVQVAAMALRFLSDVCQKPADEQKLEINRLEADCIVSYYTRGHVDIGRFMDAVSQEFRRDVMHGWLSVPEHAWMVQGPVESILPHGTRRVHYEYRLVPKDAPGAFPVTYAQRAL